MKYFIRALVLVPAICASLSTGIALIYTISESLWFLPIAIGDWVATYILLSHYESLVRDFKEYLKNVCEKTPVYGKV